MSCPMAVDRRRSLLKYFGLVVFDKLRFRFPSDLLQTSELCVSSACYDRCPNILISVIHKDHQRTCKLHNIRSLSLIMTHQQLECTRQRLLSAVTKQGADTPTMSEHVADHFSTSTTVQFRHVPMALAHLSSGWVTGLQGVRSYFDMCSLYWRRKVYLRQNSMVIDAENMTVVLVIESHWEWRNPIRGSPWTEVIQGTLSFDFDFKVFKAEYITISGDDTYFMWRQNACTPTSGIHSTQASHSFFISCRMRTYNSCEGGSEGRACSVWEYHGRHE